MSTDEKLAARRAIRAMAANRRKQRGEPVRIITGPAEIITFRPRIVIDLHMN